MPSFQRITIALWYDSDAEDAAKFYTSIFPNSRITTVTRFSEAGQEIHHRAPGSVMAVAFELDGTTFSAINGGPLFKFTEAVSMQVNCKDQKEIDYYWEKLGAGGDAKAQVCGWLKDRYGLSWQVVPENISDFYRDEKSGGAQRAMAAMLKMKKLDVAALQRAYAGEG